MLNNTSQKNLISIKETRLNPVNLYPREPSKLPCDTSSQINNFIQLAPSTHC